MNKEIGQSKTLEFVRDLCKGKTEQELLEAEQNFMDYLLVIKEICNRIERENRGLADLDHYENEQ